MTTEPKQFLEQLFEKAIAADPAFGGAYTELAQAYMAAGDQEALLDLWRLVGARGYQSVWPTQYTQLSWDIIAGSATQNR